MWTEIDIDSILNATVHESDINEINQLAFELSSSDSDTLDCLSMSDIEKELPAIKSCQLKLKKKKTTRHKMHLRNRNKVHKAAMKHKSLPKVRLFDSVPDGITNFNLARSSTTKYIDRTQ